MIEPWLDEDRADMTELVAAARRWLESSHATQLWKAAAVILAKHGDPADGEVIAKPLEEALDALWAPKQGFGHAMAMHTLGEVLGPMCEAAGKLGVTESLYAAMVGLVTAETHLVDDERGPCALALAASGRGLDDIVRGVEGQLAREHAHRVTPGQVLAIGALGTSESAERRDQLAALVSQVPHDEGTKKLAVAIALADLGKPSDVAAAVAATLANERYSHGDTAKDRVFALGIVANRKDVPGELASAYVLDMHVDVHRAAMRALRARGLPAPAFTLYDPLLVSELAARGNDAISAGLADRNGLYRQNLALWICDHPDDAFREPLAAVARAIAADPSFTDEGPVHYELRWVVRALLAVGGAADVLEELLRYPNRDVAEPVIRYVEELPAELAAGVVHVYVNDQHWKQGAAKTWLAAHKADPEVIAALADHGLAVSDISRAAEDEDDEEVDDEEDEDDEEVDDEEDEEDDE